MSLFLTFSLPMLAAAAPVPTYRDAAAELRLSFAHRTGAQGDFLFPEITGAGAALFDFDRDGDLDAFLVQSGSMDEKGENGRDRLFRNDLSDGGGFVDVTEAMLPPEAGYGIGVAAGDVDGDGWVDLYVSNYGADQLLGNVDGKRFEDRTEQAGLGLSGWSTSASFFDADRDGDLDLYVARYVEFDTVRNPSCVTTSGRRDYCGPNSFEGQTDRFYRNLGNGRFRDETLAGFGEQVPRAGLGVVAVDFDLDGDQDLYVANDGEDNFLWVNQGDGRFEEDALFAGVAVNGSGRPEASMGVAAGDFDGDGDADLFMSHLMGESNTLFQNNGRLRFSDVTEPTGLGASSFPYTGWGTAFVDLDFDGWLDIVTFNGAVRTLAAQLPSPWPFVEPNQAWRNEGGRSFVEISSALGEDFGRALSSRGVAQGDVDNDGDIDFLVNNAEGPAQLLLAEGQPDRPWVGVTLPAAPGQGALVIIDDGGRKVLRRAATDGSYASGSDPRVVFYPENANQPLSVRIRWPDGVITESTLEATHRYLEIGRDDSDR